jgi:hypothetical protein
VEREELRTVHAPLKQRYRDESEAALVTRGINRADTR